MDCFLDFCLACDKQTTEGLYCSQACRLADLEKAGSSTPTSPFTPAAESSRSYFPSSSSGFHLPPALNFKSTDMSSISPIEDSSSLRRALSPSSSRSSLSSSSGQSAHPISEQARHELQGYASAFDQTREMKRRSLSSH